MNIIKINTIPSFIIVPRKKIDISRAFKFSTINEMTQDIQDIDVEWIEILPNENYLVIMHTFPNGNAGHKFSYKIIDILLNETISIGKFMIVSENEIVQDYSKKSTNKFYN